MKYFYAALFPASLILLGIILYFGAKCILLPDLPKPIEKPIIMTSPVRIKAKIVEKLDENVYLLKSEEGKEYRLTIDRRASFDSDKELTIIQWSLNGETYYDILTEVVHRVKQ